MPKLSERLKTVFENLIPNKDVWDICCDHGLMGITAYKSKKFPTVYFIDQVPSIMEKLKDLFLKYELKNDSESKAVFICTAGEDIKTNVTGTVCITGIGGLNIFKILEGLSKNNFLNADRLILGPHKDNMKLLELIQKSSQLDRYQLKSEIKVVESNKERSLYVLERKSKI